MREKYSLWRVFEVDLAEEDQQLLPDPAGSVDHPVHYQILHEHGPAVPLGTPLFDLCENVGSSCDL